MKAHPPIGFRVDLRKMWIILLMILPSLMAYAQEEEEDDYNEEVEYEQINYKLKKGFMYGVNIGILMANKASGLFYNGTPPNDITNYLNNNNSNTYQQISEFVGGYNFHLVELPLEMRYKPGINFGLNMRYQKDWYGAWVADLNYSQLTANGLVVIEVERPNTSGATQANYEYFDIYGKESRLMISTGYQFTLSEPSSMGFVLELGPMLTSVKARKNAFRVGTREYNILRNQRGIGNQYIHNKQPTVNDFGAYAALGFNIEFDKFTVDALFRMSYEKVQFDPEVDTKHKMQYLPHLRFAYRIIK